MDGMLVEGYRNNGLTSYAGALRAQGLNPSELLQALRQANYDRCIPPLPDSEIRNIAKSAATWPPHPTGDVVHRATVPRGCFDPRASVCGFDAAAVVEADTTLHLKQRHKDLYSVLVGFFGPYGCHPCQDTIAEALGTSQQQVARDVKRLVGAGLIRVDAGAYRAGDRRYSANTYHFRRHYLFAAEFARHSSPVLNKMADFSQQFQEGTLQPAEIRPVTLKAQRDNGFLTTQSVVVEPICALGWDVDGSKSHPQLSLGNTTPEYPGSYYIIRYTECVAGCGGCRVEYSDGTSKRYECSCDPPSALETAA